MTRILLDVDGVIADFVTPACRVISELNGAEFTPSEVLDWDLARYVRDESKRPDFWEAVSAPGFCISLEPYEGAVDAVKRLMADFEVFFVTSPMASGESWAYERAQWLKGLLGAKHDQIVSTGAKHLIVGDLLVDDNAKHVARWALAHPRSVPVLWARSYNMHELWPSHGARTDLWPAIRAFADGVRA